MNRLVVNVARDFRDMFPLNRHPASLASWLLGNCWRTIMSAFGFSGMVHYFQCTDEKWS